MPPRVERGLSSHITAIIAANMTPSLSVLVAVHNAASPLKWRLDSVLTQTYPCVSPIVVTNDGSTNETAAVVARCPVVTRVSQDDRGVKHSRARLIGSAPGDLLRTPCAADWAQTTSPACLVRCSPDGGGHSGVGDESVPSICMFSVEICSGLN